MKHMAALVDGNQNGTLEDNKELKKEIEAGAIEANGGKSVRPDMPPP